ncbi:hypothetical protein [Nocardioides sp. LS1]|uniref:hypothetical protein n=1 Tax=Nocardioides sp. LS1 TaxID=1027620 RepID=UPI000F6249D9|nr:hypothetical protein [Nocardioides sp. LS1]GCD89209.1 hypothetical protein NLS1_12150 [Nocardioides sp. LS1]
MPTLESAAPGTLQRQVVVGLVLVAVIVALGFGVRWWTHPSVFGDGGFDFRALPQPVAHSARDLQVTFSADEQPVTLEGVEPVWADNTARATVAFSVCRGDSHRLAIGAPAGDAEIVCDPLRPAVEGTRIDPRQEYVVATITPTAAGVARLVGVRLTYATGASRLFQRGTEVVHLDATVVAR